MIWRPGIIILAMVLQATLMGCAALQTFLPVPTATPAATEYINYTVRAGDTLGQIALQFHMTIEQLIALNSDRYPTLARDPSVLQPGWRLRVPARNASAAARATADAVAPSIDLSPASTAIVDSINAARAQRGLGLLRTEAVLTRMASDRSADMIARDYFSHYDPQTGQEPLLRYLQATGYAYVYAGENIAEIKNGSDFVLPWLTVAARYSPPQVAAEFVKDWLNSPEHRANIFNLHYRRTGVGVAVTQDGRRIVATQAFSD